MAYFKYFPQLEILNRTKNETSSDETHIVTNLFKRVKIREDILGVRPVPLRIIKLIQVKDPILSQKHIMVIQNLTG